ncbi:MAG: hypothetical protein ACR2ME_01075 [Acidimicrobiia bacterium]
MLFAFAAGLGESISGILIAILVLTPSPLALDLGHALGSSGRLLCPAPLWV